MNAAGCIPYGYVRMWWLCIYSIFVNTTLTLFLFINNFVNQATMKPYLVLVRGISLQKENLGVQQIPPYQQ